MEKLKMEYAYKYSYSSTFGRPFSCEKEEDYLKSYRLIDNDGKIVFGLWIEFHHSSNGWQNTVSAFMTDMTNTLKNPILLKEARLSWNFTNLKKKL